MTGSFSGMVLGRTIGNPPNSNQADHKLNQVIFDLPEGCCLIVPSDRGCPSVGRSESNV